MNPTSLFDPSKIKKFFNILRRLGRCTEDRYKGYDKLNPHMSPCEKEVFVKRTLHKFLKGKHLVWYKKSDDTGLFYNLYVSVGSISYALGWGEDINVYLYDYSRPVDMCTSIELNHNSVLELEGMWCENNNLHNAMLELSKLDLPEREFIFEAIDFNKHPKRRRKTMTDEDVKRLMDTTVSFRCRLLADAEKLALKFQSDPANKGIMISKLKGVL